MGSFNRVTVCGYLGATPEIMATQTGGKIAKLRLATSESWVDKRSGERVEQTEWHSIKIFNEATVDYVEKALDKGDLVLVEGRLKTRKWTDKDNVERWTTEIHVSFGGGITLIHRSDENKAARGTRQGMSSSSNDDQSGGSSIAPRNAKASAKGVPDDEIPF